MTWCRGLECLKLLRDGNGQIPLRDACTPLDVFEQCEDWPVGLDGYVHYDPSGALAVFDNDKDVWRIHGRMPARHHQQPRRLLYSPRASDGAPPSEQLTSRRFTVAKMPDGSYRTLLDNWSRALDREPWENLWTGRGLFFTSNHNCSFPLGMEAVGPGAKPTWESKEAATAGEQVGEISGGSCVEDNSLYQGIICDEEHGKDCTKSVFD